VRAAVIVIMLSLLASPVFAQESPPDSIGGCPKLSAKAPDKWIGLAVSDRVNIRTGPGTEFPIHASGQLLTGETVYVLQECKGWLQARVIGRDMVDPVYRAHGEEKAEEMLVFWVRKDLVRRK
jgi:SH3-like domain-containing protein